MFAGKEGAVLNWQGGYERTLLMMENEQINMAFGVTNGAIRIKPIEAHNIHVLIYNSSFNNAFARYGQALSLFETGKLLLMNSNFTTNLTFF